MRKATKARGTRFALSTKTTGVALVVVLGAVVPAWLPATAAPDGNPVVRPAATPVVKPGAPAKRVKGYVLSHEHPTYGMAFGGNYAFAGAPGNYRNGIMEKGYTAACGGCKMLSGCDHGEVKGNFTAALGSLGRDMGDHKSFKGPLSDSNSHLRYSTEWIKEAFNPTEPEFKDSRMRIMVAYAVENEAMCEQLYYANKGKGGAGGDGYPCSNGDSLQSLDRQLDALKAWVKENSSWMEIAYTAADARRIVEADKLAVILGVEAEYAFGAENRTFDPVSRLAHYYDEGVRTFYLAHKINSRLSGADIYYPKDTDPGKAVRATQAISGCFYYDDYVGPFPLKNKEGHYFCTNSCGDGYFKGNKLFGLTDECANRLGEISEVNMADYVLARGGGEFDGFAIYPNTPGFKSRGGSHMDGAVERNNLGLSHDGERVVREAMIKGMMVNIDHVSSNARKDIYTLATGDFGGYPVNAFHNNPNKMLVGGAPGPLVPSPHEYDFDDSELAFIRETGGFFGVRLGPLDAADYPASGVNKNCPRTSTESAKILAYLIDQGMNLGYSLDYATITQGVHSRTVENCGLDLGADPIDQYGSEGAEGISHVGMMKKWHKELQTVGLKSRYIDKLRDDGVEAFLAMWDKSEVKSKVGHQIPRQTFGNNLSALGGTCKKDSECTVGKCTDVLGAAGVCVCTQDADCGSGKFCDAGVDLHKNVCLPLKADNETCALVGGGHQCKSGHCAFSHCYTPKSAAMGNTCYCDDACKEGKCSAVDGFKGECVCKDDSDCGAGKWCDGGLDLKINVCRTKLDDGESCGKAGSMGNDHKCKSGKCSGFPNYKCK